MLRDALVGGGGETGGGVSLAFELWRDPATGLAHVAEEGEPVTMCERPFTRAHFGVVQSLEFERKFDWDDGDVAVGCEFCDACLEEAREEIDFMENWEVLEA